MIDRRRDLAHPLLRRRCRSHSTLLMAMISWLRRVNTVPRTPVPSSLALLRGTRATELAERRLGVFGGFLSGKSHLRQGYERGRRTNQWLHSVGG